MSLRALQFAAFVCLALCGAVSIGGAAADQVAAPAASAEGIEFFEARIRPLLAQHCWKCHGAEKKGGLELDSRADMLKGSDSGAVVTPGDPERSLLIQAVRYVDEPKMPPDGKLADESIAQLTAWVKMGAPWPANLKANDSRQHGEAKDWKLHWAFQPIARPGLPRVNNAGWARQSLDRYVLAALEDQSLSPSPAADRRTLIRRATYDVIGLPPTASEIEAFINDASPDAYETVIERLLASPHYGERWARHWLDVARYADTKGYVFTQDRKYPNAYRYRDWVVRALNEDLPYDQFLVRQIAADRLPLGEDKSALAAMGFLTVGRRFLNNQHDIIDDRLDVLTRGTMGLTVTCARCHDHKYDPIPTRDYYSLYGVLASSREPDEGDFMTLVDREQPVEPHVFVRGNPGNRGDAVPRQFLEVLSGPDRRPFHDGSGRLDLARAIASPDNPLTARVIVNRVWQYYFDTPLVRTPSDFGMRSEPPTNPALLDHLAGMLIDSHWSLKELHRAILRSAAYQQASEDRPECRKLDPENALYWRMNRKRLDFEALRDSLLAASGELERTLGGPAVELAKSPGSKRRTLYGLIDRQNLPALFRTFDFASPDTHSPQRFNTTVPQQALFLMNSPFARDRATALAARSATADFDQPRARVIGLYRLALGRQPSADEIDLAVRFVQTERAAASGGSAPRGDSRSSAWERLAQVLLLSNEFMYVD